jgi:hypothetical protein
MTARSRIGRIYEDRGPERRKTCDGSGRSRFTSIPRAGIVTSGKVPTLEEAKARFRTSWERVKAHMAAKNIDHAEPDPSPFKVHLMTRAGRVMRARGGPVRELSTKDEAVKFAGRQLGGHYAVYHNHKKIWPVP